LKSISSKYNDREKLNAVDHGIANSVDYFFSGIIPKNAVIPSAGTK
jgi:hypothetical protein